MPAVTAILTVQGLEKSFGTRRVLRGVSFAVQEGDRIGLVGVNGSGKSTLLRIMVGPATVQFDELPVEEPDAGLVTRKRDLRLHYVPQEPRLEPGKSVIDTLREGLVLHRAVLTRLEEVGAGLESAAGDGGGRGAAGAAVNVNALLAEQARLHDRVRELGGWDLDHEIRAVSSALELPPWEAEVGTLSIGERRRVSLGQALLARPDLLALDEPTNHLDARTVAWLEERLLQHQGALLLVTHDRYFLDRVATRILELDRGQVHAYEGGYTRFLEKQAERLENEAAREDARASFVRRELDWIRRGPAARTTKQKARIDRFDEAVAARPGAADRAPRRLALRLPSGGRLGKTILELREVTRRIGDRTLFKDLSLILKPGERIGIVGPNGAGKTTLIRTILGQIPPDSGEVVVGPSTRFAYLDQGRADLNDERTVLEEVAGGHDHVFIGGEAGEGQSVHVRTFLRMMLFDDGFADTPVSALSGGERNRVQLARLLRIGGNVLILDEPTNDLDLMTLGVLEEALESFAGCALVVSHDRWFLDRVATSILAFEGEGRVVLHEGNYSDYLARGGKLGGGAQETRPAAGPAAPAKPESNPVNPALDMNRTKPASRRLSIPEQRELAGMEEAILAAEARHQALQEELADPAFYRERGAEVAARTAALEQAQKEVERLYERWQELESRKS
jgi:ATP-binding cassette subfamily F protein uup